MLNVLITMFEHCICMGSQGTKGPREKAGGHIWGVIVLLLLFAYDSSSKGSENDESKRMMEFLFWRSAYDDTLLLYRIEQTSHTNNTSPVLPQTLDFTQDTLPSAISFHQQARISIFVIVDYAAQQTSSRARLRGCELVGDGLLQSGSVATANTRVPLF